MARITVMGGNQNKKISAEPGENLLSLLVGAGYHIPADCGGRGRCGKCAVRLISGTVSGVPYGEAGRYLACVTHVSGDAVIEIFERSGEGVTAAKGGAVFTADGEIGYGIALDVGTTTLAAYLLDLATGREIAAKSCLNPQCAMGADVVTRIQKCTEGGLTQLRKLLLDKVKELVQDLKNEHDVPEIIRMTVAANTTMLHIFAGIDPTPLGRVPFAPVFTGERILEDCEALLGVKTAILLPSVSAYIGSDITAGILFSGMEEESEPCLLIDIGTNGEMVAKKNGRYFSCSTAAGPAFEGANISCGMGGVKGAINSVFVEGGDLRYTTISGEAQGLCGCGLVDAVALLVREKLIDETGVFREKEEVLNSALRERMSEEGFRLAAGVTLTQKDIRETQLAKSAVCAGVEILLSKAGISPEQLGKVYLAGGFGFYLDKTHAAEIGLYPAVLTKKIVEVGNSSGGGAKLCLVSREMRRRCAQISEKVENLELSELPEFMDRYLANMYFGE